MRIHGYDFDCPSFPDRLFLSYLSLILPRLPSCPLAFPSHPHRIISLFRHIHTPAKVRRHLHTESSNSRPAQASADTSMHTPRYRLPQKADWMKGYRLQGNWDEWKADGRRSWCACKSIFPTSPQPCCPRQHPVCKLSVPREMHACQRNVLHESVAHHSDTAAAAANKPTMGQSCSERPTSRRCFLQSDLSTRMAASRCP